MSDQELQVLLSQRMFDREDQTKVVNEWNERRPEYKISMSAVRTPCRLKQIIGSFKIFLDSKNSVSSS